MCCVPRAPKNCFSKCEARMTEIFCGVRCCCNRWIIQRMCSTSSLRGDCLSMVSSPVKERVVRAHRVLEEDKWLAMDSQRMPLRAHLQWFLETQYTCSRPLFFEDDSVPERGILSRRTFVVRSQNLIRTQNVVRARCG